MRVKEELLINILKGLHVGDDPVKLPSWCSPRDVKQSWDRTDRSEKLLLTEDNDRNIHVQVASKWDITFWWWLFLRRQYGGCGNDGQV